MSESLKIPDPASGRKLLQVLGGESVWPPPIWMMRQAGRYLAEYQRVRAEAGSFLALCDSPELSAEVTLQPIRRFGFDAAILFSDILVVPRALGRTVEFREGEGPALEPIRVGEIEALRLDGFVQRLASPIETVGRVRAALPDEVTLIGFCGAPWTVATYMVAGHGTPDQAPARLFAYREPEAFGRLIEVLVEASIAYLSAQIEAGADLVQIFDTWAGILPPGEFERWVVGPTARIVAGIRVRHPGARIIGFPRGAAGRLGNYVAATGVDAVGLDWTVTAAEGRFLQESVAVQGNLDPLLLGAGGAALDGGVDRVLKDFGAGRLIFNLGHGIGPTTPVAHVEAMIRRVRSTAL